MTPNLDDYMIMTRNSPDTTFVNFKENKAKLEIQELINFFVKSTGVRHISFTAMYVQLRHFGLFFKIQVRW